MRSHTSDRQGMYPMHIDTAAFSIPSRRLCAHIERISGRVLHSAIDELGQDL
jgi:hypothetical protein